MPTPRPCSPPRAAHSAKQQLESPLFSFAASTNLRLAPNPANHRESEYHKPKVAAAEAGGACDTLHQPLPASSPPGPSTSFHLQRGFSPLVATPPAPVTPSPHGYSSHAGSDSDGGGSGGGGPPALSASLPRSASGGISRLGSSALAAGGNLSERLSAVADGAQAGDAAAPCTEEAAAAAAVPDFSTMPDECWLDVLKGLNVHELCSVSRVSRGLRAATCQPGIWAVRYASLFGEEAPAEWNAATVRRMCRRSELRAARCVRALSWRPEGRHVR